MTSEERRAVRQALIAAGFTRTGYTRDYGDGVYTESWRRAGKNVVEISWGPRS